MVDALQTAIARRKPAPEPVHHLQRRALVLIPTLDAAFTHLTQRFDSSGNPSLQALQLTGSTFTSTAVRDRGVQYTSLSFGKRLEDKGLVPSMGQVGSAYDYALAESFVATLKMEFLYGNAWPTRQVARTALFKYIEGFYNPRGDIQL